MPAYAFNPWKYGVVIYPHSIEAQKHIVFDEQIPSEYSQRFWALLAPSEELHNFDWRGIQEQMLDSVLLLAHRVSGLGVESELMRASTNFDDDTPSFIALSAEALDFVNSMRAALNDPSVCADAGSQLQVIAAQCRDSLQRIRKRALTVGTSLHLSYLLTRSEQCLLRLKELLIILTASQTTTTRHGAIEAWASFAGDAFLAENRRNSLGHYMEQLSRTNIISRGMGGISAGYADLLSINFNNPATYASFQSVKEAKSKKLSSGRAILDLGLNFDTRTLREPAHNKKFVANNALFSYVQVGVPLKARLGTQFRYQACFPDQL